MMRLEELFQNALDLPAQDRDAFLEQACAGDHERMAAVQRLLASDQAADEQTFWKGNALHAESRFDAPAGPSRVGQVLGDYRIVDVIGEGGMGTVYRALRADAQYDQAVAIKIVRGGFDSAALTERFRQERQILANLGHPNIARLLDGGATPDGLPYLVMEFIAGQLLTSYCNQHHLGIAERLRLFRQVCAAVEYAHQRLVIHRDLKPGNILVNEGGEVKLLDFGVAKLVAADADPLAQQTLGMNWLTPAYASPEQICGEPMTTASDVYSLGVILYELLSGHSPYRGKMGTLPEAMRVVREEEPLPPSVAVDRDAAGKSLARKLHGDLDRIVLKALRKDPSRRYGSVEQFSDDLRRHLAGLPVRARGDAAAYRAAKFVRRHAIPVAAAAAVFLTLVVGIVMTLRAEARARRQFNEVRRLAHTVLFDYHDAIAALPGSTPVREKLVKDALGYLDGLSQQAQDEVLEREIALAYVKVADVQGNTYNSNLGDTAGAMDSARKAVAHAVPLYQKAPSGENAFALGRAYMVLGSIIHSSDQIAGAESYYKRAATMLEKAVASQPANFEWKMRYIETLDHLADLYGLEGYSNLGRSKDALVAYNRALELDNQLLQKYPESHDAQQTQLSVMLNVAEEEHRLGRAAAAESGYRTAIAGIGRMSAGSDSSPTDRQNLAVANFDLANQLSDNGKPLEALPHMRWARDIVQQIALADPRNTLYQRSLAARELGLCRTIRLAADAARALPYCRDALAALQKLSASDPKSGEERSDVANAMLELGAVQLASGDPQAALMQERRALTILHDMPEQARDENLRLYIVRASVTAGEAELALGQKQDAVVDFQTAVDVAEELVQDDPDQAYNRLDRTRAKTRLAHALAATGQCSQAQPLFQQASEEWKSLRELGILPAADATRPEQLAAVLRKCEPAPAMR
ncbi:MAG TPA: serine/threonine-protein kinase [Candidatus Angelobacter sp.]|nr:serine/threonine-protein kinase [Candidatus Angelobacter sp.]